MTLTDEIRGVLKPGMVLPEPIEALLAWIEEHGDVEVSDGVTYGCLSNPEEDPLIGTWFECAADNNEGIEDYFKRSRRDQAQRLAAFGRTGTDGTITAFWLDDAGRQRIVQIGSGSGSLVTCVLADDPVDFLRLLAIGYMEVAWPDVYRGTPDEVNEEDVVPHLEFRAWVSERYGVDIPERASDLVAHPDSMDDDDPTDEFARWMLGAWK